MTCTHCVSNLMMTVSSTLSILAAIMFSIGEKCQGGVGGGGVVVKRIQFCLMKTKWLLCTPKFAYISGYIVLSSFLFFISLLSRLGNANFLRSQIRKFIYLFISPYFTHCRRCISGALIFS